MFDVVKTDTSANSGCGGDALKDPPYSQLIPTLNYCHCSILHDPNLVILFHCSLKTQQKTQMMYLTIRVNLPFLTIAV
jgi:hypothetical protein